MPPPADESALARRVLGMADGLPLPADAASSLQAAQCHTLDTALGELRETLAAHLHPGADRDRDDDVPLPALIETLVENIAQTPEMAAALEPVRADSALYRAKQAGRNRCYCA